MINKLLYKLTSRLPCRIIKLDSGRPYLERYYLGCLRGVTFYLHRFVSSDSERHVHNHPWSRGGSLILSGGYIEERCIDISPTVEGSGCVTQFAKRRWFNRVDGNTFHRIHEAEPGTWTLFFHGSRATINGQLKGWGFLERLFDNSVVFTVGVSSPSNWWETAPTGNKVGRSPL